jgi:Tfp pilus assembly protein PilV
MGALRKFVRREEGTTLVEVMIAMFILSVGLVGSMNLILVAISSNARSRRDSTSTALAEMIVDQISAIPVGASTTTVTITDCASNSIAVNTAGSSGGTGANLSGGNIDFTQSFSSIASGYAMKYTVCGASSGTQAVYDVRWNVQLVPSGKATLVAVGARLSNSGSSGQMYAPSFNVRTVVGNSGN